MRIPLDADEVAALLRFKRRQGRQWKMVLRSCWRDGFYGANPDAALLQSVRNKIGSKGLGQLNLAHAQAEANQKGVDHGTGYQSILEA